MGEKNSDALKYVQRLVALVNLCKIFLFKQGKSNTQYSETPSHQVILSGSSIYTSGSSIQRSAKSLSVLSGRITLFVIVSFMPGFQSLLSHDFFLLNVCLTQLCPVPMLLMALTEIQPLHFLNGILFFILLFLFAKIT